MKIKKARSKFWGNFDPDIVKELKGGAVIFGIAAVVFIFIYFIWPYTDVGKEAYQNNRQNAINYIWGTINLNEEGYVKERSRLMEKYDLYDLFSADNNTLPAGIGFRPDRILHETD